MLIIYILETIPALFSTFNKMAAVMILGQICWYKQVNKSDRRFRGSNPAKFRVYISSNFITVAISQMYVILDISKLINKKTKC